MADADEQGQPHLKVALRGVIAGYGRRRRAGFEFSREPVELTRDDFPAGVEGATRVLAIVTDPALSVTLVWPDGTEVPPTEKDITDLQTVIAAFEAQTSQGDAVSDDLWGDLLDTNEPTDTETQSQAASGADGNPDGAAASAGEPDAKAVDATENGTAAADPAGTSDASATSGEALREQAADASADQKDAPDAGKQPEDAVQPPVAEQDKPKGPAKKPAGIKPKG